MVGLHNGWWGYVLGAVTYRVVVVRALFAGSHQGKRSLIGTVAILHIFVERRSTVNICFTFK